MKNLIAKQIKFNFVDQELLVTQHVKKAHRLITGSKKINLRWTVPLRNECGIFTGLRENRPLKTFSAYA